MWRSKDEFLELILSFHYVDLRDLTPVVSLDIHQSCFYWGKLLQELMILEVDILSWFFILLYFIMGPGHLI